MNKGIQKIFSEASHSYELVNHILTWGLDIRWRKKSAKAAAVEGGTRWMDICSGTGETAAYLSRLAKNGTTVVSADFTFDMLYEATKKPEANRITFTLADAGRLPFRDETFDLVTISFATRNINVNRDALLRCFREFYRVLKPGGRFVNLETSQPSSALIRRLFHLYIRSAVASIGSMISGSKAAYAYLSHTIPRFYNAVELSDILRQAGFAEVSIHNMMFGIAAIHKAIK